VFIIRFALKGKLTQRLIKFEMLRAPPTAQSVAALLTNVLSVTLGVGLDNCLAFIHDRASTNIAAVDMLTLVVTPEAIDIGKG
jgi:hypothetical protein